MKAVRELMAAKRFEEASESLKTMMRQPNQEPSFAALSTLGVCLQELKQYTEAIEVLNRAAELDPTQVENEPKFWKMMADLAEAAGSAFSAACGDYISKQLSIALKRSNFARAADLLVAAVSKYMHDGTLSSCEKACELLTTELKQSWICSTADTEKVGTNVSPQVLLGLLEQLVAAQANLRELKEKQSVGTATLGRKVGTTAEVADSWELLPLLLLMVTAATAVTSTADNTSGVSMPLALCAAAQKVLHSLRDAACVQSIPRGGQAQAQAAWSDVKEACFALLNCPSLHPPGGCAAETAGALGLEACLHLAVHMHHAELTSGSTLLTQIQTFLHAATPMSGECVLGQALTAAQLLSRGRVLAAEPLVAACQAHWQRSQSASASASLSPPRVSAGTGTGTGTYNELNKNALGNSWMQDSLALWVVVCSRCLANNMNTSLSDDELLAATAEALQRAEALNFVTKNSSSLDQTIISSSIRVVLQWARLIAVGAGGVASAAAAREAVLLRPDLFVQLPGTTRITVRCSFLTELSVQLLQGRLFIAEIRMIFSVLHTLSLSEHAANMAGGLLDAEKASGLLPLVRLHLQVEQGRALLLHALNLMRKQHAATERCWSVMAGLLWNMDASLPGFEKSASLLDGAIAALQVCMLPVPPAADLAQDQDTSVRDTAEAYPHVLLLLGAAMWARGGASRCAKSGCTASLLAAAKADMSGTTGARILLPEGGGSTYSLLGHVYLYAGTDVSKATKCYLKALALWPGDAEAGLLLSRVYLLSEAAGGEEKALKLWADVTKLAGQAPVWVLMLRCRLHMVRARAEPALLDLQALLARRPGTYFAENSDLSIGTLPDSAGDGSEGDGLAAAHWLLLGTLHSAAQQTSTARQCYVRAIKEAPADPVVECANAELSRRQGDSASLKAAVILATHAKSLALKAAFPAAATAALVITAQVAAHKADISMACGWVAEAVQHQQSGISAIEELLKLAESGAGGGRASGSAWHILGDLCMMARSLPNSNTNTDPKLILFQRAEHAYRQQLSILEPGSEDQLPSIWHAIGCALAAQASLSDAASSQIAAVEISAQQAFAEGIRAGIAASEDKEAVAACWAALAVLSKSALARYACVQRALQIDPACGTALSVRAEGLLRIASKAEIGSPESEAVLQKARESLRMWGSVDAPSMWAGIGTLCERQGASAAEARAAHLSALEAVQRPEPLLGAALSFLRIHGLMHSVNVLVSPKAVRTVALVVAIRHAVVVPLHLYLQLHEPTPQVEAILSWAEQVFMMQNTAEVVTAEAAKAGDGDETAWGTYMVIRNGAQHVASTVTVMLLEQALQRFPFSVGLWLLLAEQGGGHVAQAMDTAMPSRQARSSQNPPISQETVQEQDLLPIVSPKQSILVAIFLLQEVLRKPFVMLDNDSNDNTVGEQRLSSLDAQNNWTLLSFMCTARTPSSQPEHRDASGLESGVQVVLCNAWVQLSRLVHATANSSDKGKGKGTSKEGDEGHGQEKEQEQREREDIRRGLLRCLHLVPWQMQVATELSVL